MLLLLRYLEPVLQKNDAIADQNVFECRTFLKEVLVLPVGAETHYVLNPKPVVPATIKNDDLSARWHLFHVTLGIELSFLAIRGGGQRDEAKHARAHPLHHAFDNAALAGCVTTFKNDNDARSSFLHPLLQLDQFHLYLENLSLVFLVLHFGYSAEAGVSCTVSIDSGFYFLLLVLFLPFLRHKRLLPKLGFSSLPARNPGCKQLKNDPKRLTGINPQALRE